ncbi:MAG: DUF45 domain-containing protein [Candidatus Heimdallarchaeota archaeon]|nr:DUF45 domain-containing protein [Candidatus Heimdallarchaeota archaeon]
MLTNYFFLKTRDRNPLYILSPTLSRNAKIVIIKPIICLEFIIVHELVHLLERHHNDNFIYFMDLFMPLWRKYRDELNSLPLNHANWTY